MPLTDHRLAAAALLLVSLAAPACARAEAPAAASQVGDTQAAMPAAPMAAASAPGGGGSGAQTPESTRKIIKNAELRFDVKDARAARDQATQLAERAGGYVASSTENRAGEDAMQVHLTLKVPSARLTAVLGELRGLAERVDYEHVGSQDVTAEFQDLEARLRAQRAVEGQLLAIAREAHTVPDLLAVQRQLGEVRGEIERMEGRRNQIDHQVSLSTVQLTLQRPGSPASASLTTTFHKAGSDAVAVGSALVHGTVRTVGVLVPLGLFFAPLGYLAWRLVRLLHRRAQRALFRPRFGLFSRCFAGPKAWTGARRGG